MPTFINPSAMDLPNYGLQGLRIYAQLWDATLNAGAGGFTDEMVDFGIVEDFSPSLDEQESTLDSSRNGTRAPVKTLSQSVTENFTFTSANFGDPTTLALFSGGGEALTGTNGRTVILRRPGGSTRARLFVLGIGSANTDGEVMVIPNAEIKGGEETASNGSEARRLGFNVKGLADETYRIPVALLASNDAAPYGARIIVVASATPVPDAEAVVDLLAA